MKKIVMFLFMVVTGLSHSAGQGQIKIVPSPNFPTIQSAINAALPGDTIRVLDGTYYEQINFMGKKPLTVASEYLFDGDTSHIYNTSLDGSQITDLTNGSIVSFKSGEDTTSVLCGFTIRNGNTGTLHPVDTIAGFTLYERAGGGIIILNSGAKIIHNRIIENHITDANLPGNPSFVYGGGMSTYPNDNDLWVVLDHNVIENNSAHSNEIQAASGGVCIQCNARVTNNQIHGNHLTSGVNTSAIAGGMGLSGDPAIPVLLTAFVQNNSFVGNTASSPNEWASSGGFLSQHYKCVFEGNIVKDNSINGQLRLGAGGARFSQSRTGTVIRNNRFENNSEGSGGGVEIETNYGSGNPDVFVMLVENNYFIANFAEFGGGIKIQNNPVLLQNNIFSENNANNSGGAVYIEGGQMNTAWKHRVIMVNNTFYQNHADSGGAVFSKNYGNPLILNSIFWKDNAIDSSHGMEMFISDTLELAYCDIDTTKILGAWNNGGLLFCEDPGFSDLITFEITPFSPCFNTGIDSFLCECGVYTESPDYDIFGNFRPLWGYFDIGATECLIDFINDQKAHKFSSAYPNPFNAYTTFSYTLDQPCRVVITVFDMEGRQMGVVLDEYQLQGQQEVMWNTGNLKTGIYLYTITAGERSASGKLVRQ